MRIIVQLCDKYEPFVELRVNYATKYGIIFSGIKKLAYFKDFEFFVVSNVTFV